jgi:hypothetical protein
MHHGLDPREVELLVRELELTRREEALKRAEQSASLPRMPAAYFEGGSDSDEDGWWALQLGRT